MKILVIKNDWMFKGLPKGMRESFSFIKHGWGNGYALIPRGNVLHGKHYDEINSVVSVHGGLTFSRMITGRNYKFFGLSKRHLGKWMVGFDTVHAWDNEETCNRSYVIRESYNLRKQLFDFEKQCHTSIQQ